MRKYNKGVNFKLLLIVNTFSKLFGGEIYVTERLKKSLAKLKERQDSNVIFLANALSSHVSYSTLNLNNL